ncbi:25068_t:CDS:2, partial [Gigaspora rosea]
DRIEDIKCINKIDDQSARTLVYNEIKALLPNISDVNLRQRTFRAKKIYTLLMGIGIEKIQAITCSASAISSLTDNQIQDIINCFPKNSNADIFSSKLNKETNKTLPETEVNTITTPSILLTHTSTHSVTASGNSEDMVSENDESLLETKISVHDDSLDSNSEPSDSDNENFSDNEDEYSFNKNIIFSDDEDEGYYYELSTGKTYRKSDRSI